MRLKKITLKNFGSHKNTEINFEENRINEAPIVIITGDTGAGKSTILDGIMFALYQNIFRYQKSEVASVKNFDAKDEETYAELLFDVFNNNQKQEIYVKRTFSLKNNSTSYSLDIKVDSKILSDSKINLDNKLKNIIKCDYDLFVRSIVLPQGQFAALLKTDNPSTRREILKKIFIELEIYELIKKKIDEKLKLVENEYNNITYQKQNLLTAISEKTKNLESEWDKEDISQIPQKDISYVEEIQKKIFSEIEKIISNIETQIKNFENEKDQKKKDKEIIEKSLKNLEEIQNIQTQLSETINEISKKIKEINLSIQQKITTSQDINSNLDFIKNELQNERSVIETEKENLKKIIDNFKEKSKEYETLKTTYSHLKSRIEEVGKEIGFSMENRNDIKKAQDNFKNQLNEITEKINKIEAIKIDEKLKNIAVLEEKIKQKKKFTLDKQSTEKEIEKVKSELSELLSIINIREKKIKALKEEEKEKIVQKIRLSLRNGDTCPVCGNIYEHKHKYEKHTYKEKTMVMSFGSDTQEYDKINEGQNEIEISDEIEKLEKEIRDLNLKKGSLEARINEKEEKIKNLNEEISKIESELEKERIHSEEELKNQINYLYNQKKDLENLKEKKEKLSTIIQTLNALFNEVNSQYKNIIEPSKNELENFSEKFKISLESKQILRDIIGNQKFEKMKDLFESDIGKKLEESLKELEKKEKIILEILNFITKLEGLLRLYEEKSKDINLTVNKEELETKIREIDKDIDNLQMKIDEMNNNKNTLNIKKGKIQSIILDIKNKKSELKKLEDEFNKIEEEYNIIKSLDSKFDTKEIVNFVTKIKMDEIAGKVNEYLSRLGILDKKLSINFEKDSLNFSVEYADGSINTVNSLSGGESFLFSIALAFAVANDVISNFNIKSLFIDEGFDTLDENYNTRLFSFLESFAMENGITIYIITHKQEIAENTNYPKIFVSKENGFSKVGIVAETIRT